MRVLIQPNQNYFLRLDCAFDANCIQSSIGGAQQDIVIVR